MGDFEGRFIDNFYDDFCSFVDYSSSPIVGVGLI